MKLFRYFWTISFVLILLGNSTSPVFAASLTVTKIADTDDGICDSDCSLREAINVASMGDTIVFDSSLSNQTITLNTTLKLSKDITIDGSTLAEPIIISGVTTDDGTGNYWVFIIDIGHTVTLNNLVITKSNVTAYSHSGGISIYKDAVLIINSSTISHNTGNNGGGIINWYGSLIMTNSTISNNSATSGGGIYSRGGTVTLTNVAITNNSATASGGGIHNSSNLTITNSIIADNSSESTGGGINNEGSLSLTQGAIQGNTATGGGGIYNDIYTTMDVTSSTISENTSYSAGGGIQNSGSTATVTNSTLVGNSASFGGGIYNTNGLIIANSTFHNNQATLSNGGAINNNVGTLTVTNSTFSDNVSQENGGGIYNSGTLNYSNTIIANSTGWGCYNYFSTIGLNVNNLVEDNVPEDVYGSNCGVPAFTSDSNLGPLANNGGATETMKLLAGSAAINAGDNATCTASPVNNLDQRGVSRTEGDTCEIGAYEVDTPIVASVKRLDANPALASSVTFLATFSEPVTGVDTTDFTLNTTGIAGAAITGISGVGNSYIVTVNTGSGDGTIRLDIVDNDTVKDESLNLLGGTGTGNGDFSNGQTYNIDKTAPTVVSSLRYNANPTGDSSVDFTVSFSEPVTNVDISDFSLATTGVSGAVVSEVFGSDNIYTVMVNTGTSNGSIRLDLPGSAVITDVAGNSLINLPYTAGEVYTVNRIVNTTLILKSIDDYDGWVLESGENSNAGGSLNNTTNTFKLGDDAADRQYRAILHFDTSSLPNNAVITSAILKIKKQGQNGTNPFNILGELLVDMRRPAFGSAELTLSDFKSSAGKNDVSSFDVVPVENWYSALLNNAGNLYINRTGSTQFRLHFASGDNNDSDSDFMKFFSGNAGATSRPQLIIQYYVP